jgi:arsenite transporter
VTEKRLDFFERYLSLWVFACIAIGILFGKLFPGLVATLSEMEVSHVNLPIAVLIWLMIYPMMLKIDFSAIMKVGDRLQRAFHHSFYKLDCEAV